MGSILSLHKATSFFMNRPFKRSAYQSAPYHQCPLGPGESPYQGRRKWETATMTSQPYGTNDVFVIVT